MFLSADLLLCYFASSDEDVCCLMWSRSASRIDFMVDDYDSVRDTIRYALTYYPSSSLRYY